MSLVIKTEKLKTKTSPKILKFETRCCLLIARYDFLDTGYWILDMG